MHARYICAELSRTTNPGSQHATLGAWGLRDGLPYLQSKLICDHCVDDVSCAPRVFRRVVSQEPQGRVVPLRGGQGKARSPVAYTAVSTRVSTCSFIVPTETATYLSPIPGQLTLITVGGLLPQVVLTRVKIRYRSHSSAGRAESLDPVGLQECIINPRPSTPHTCVWRGCDYGTAYTETLGASL